MMFKIRLENAKDAEEFVEAAAKCGGNIDLQSGVVYLDGKSLLGVLAMGVKKEVNVHVSDGYVDPSFEKVVQKFQIA